MKLRRRSDTTKPSATGKAATRKAARPAKARGGITPSNAKRAMAVTRVVAPVIIPYAVAAAALARNRWDTARARRLGVPPEQLGSYSGRGGALLARIAGVAGTLAELREPSQAHSAGAAHRFAVATEPRLADLAAATRAAEQMPAERRRAAHRAVSKELDRIEAELLTNLGVGRPS